MVGPAITFSALRDTLGRVVYTVTITRLKMAPKLISLTIEMINEPSGYSWRKIRKKLLCCIFENCGSILGRVLTD